MIAASFHSCMTFPSPDEDYKSVELQQDGPILSKSEVQQFQGKTVRPRCFRVCRCFIRSGNFLLGELGSEGNCDILLQEPLRGVGSSMSDFALSSE